MARLRALNDFVRRARAAPRPQVVLLCGMTGSGKTTLARDLEHALPGVRFSTDEWMVRLFGPHMPRDVFDERHTAIKELQWVTVERLVALGVHSVLDYGFWRADERAEASRRAEAAGGEPTVVFLDVPVATLEQRLSRRNADVPLGTFEVTHAMLHEFLERFEPPSDDEPARVIRVSGRARSGAWNG